MENEVPPRVSGNKGTWQKKNCWEKGNKRKIKLGTREQKENKAGIKGTKAVSDVLGKREDQNGKKNTFRVLGNKGIQGKFCWEKGNVDHPETPLEMELLGLISSEGCIEPNGMFFCFKFLIYWRQLSSCVMCLCDAVFRSLVTVVTL